MSSSSSDKLPEGSKPVVALDKSPDNWFAKFSRATETPAECFRGYADRFNGITVDSSLEGKKVDQSADTEEDNDFGRKLEGALTFDLISVDTPIK